MDKSCHDTRTHSISPRASETFLGGINWLQSEAGSGTSTRPGLVRDEH